MGLPWPCGSLTNSLAKYSRDSMEIQTLVTHTERLKIGLHVGNFSTCKLYYRKSHCNSCFFRIINASVVSISPAPATSQPPSKKEKSIILTNLISLTHSDHLVEKIPCFTADWAHYFGVIGHITWCRGQFAQSGGWKLAGGIPWYQWNICIDGLWIEFNVKKFFFLSLDSSNYSS